MAEGEFRIKVKPDSHFSFRYRIKASNVAYKHPSLLPKESEVRDLRIYVGKKYRVEGFRY